MLGALYGLAAAAVALVGIFAAACIVHRRAIRRLTSQLKED
jgi:hypothetical protein